MTPQEQEIHARSTLRFYMSEIARRAAELGIELDAPGENADRITTAELQAYCEHVQAACHEDVGTGPDVPLPHDHHSLWDDAWCAGHTLGLDVGGVYA